VCAGRPGGWPLAGPRVGRDRAGRPRPRGQARNHGDSRAAERRARPADPAPERLTPVTAWYRCPESGSGTAHILERTAMAITTRRTRYVLAGTWPSEHAEKITVNGWAVVNAPRPLLGSVTWEGPFICGIFYAAGPYD